MHDVIEFGYEIPATQSGEVKIGTCIIYGQKILNTIAKISVPEGIAVKSRLGDVEQKAAPPFYEITILCKEDVSTKRSEEIKGVLEEILKGISLKPFFLRGMSPFRDMIYAHEPTK